MKKKMEIFLLVVMVIGAFTAFKVFTGCLNSKSGRAIPANGGAAGGETPEDANILYSSRYWAGMATTSRGEEGGYHDELYVYTSGEADKKTGWVV